MENISLIFNHVSFSYKSNIILEDINIILKDRGITIIYGDNGAGKTTLLRLMARILKSDNGHIQFNENYKPSFIFQKPILLRRTVHDNLTHILTINNNTSKVAASKMAMEMLNKYNLDSISNDYVFKLSGGQQQMVSILRGLIINPNIILCDELTSNLDSKNRLIVEDILIKHSKTNKIVLVTQDKNQLVNIADEIYELKNRRLKIYERF
jgi:ABC-type nitrate/sulfonate/bicarbonate transport system ATPase subunit